MRVLLTVLIVAILSFELGKSSSVTDLEIYTAEDIYYIRDGRVMSESGEVLRYFDDRKSLKEFISDKTANDITL